MSAAHTPGPWTIFDLHDETRLNIRGPNEEFVADCADGFYSDETDDWVMAAESLPNARLIAAAPELLAELIALRKRFHNACRAGGSDDEYVSASTPGADAAIAKAAGQ